MATARQIIAMLQSHLQGDEEQFLAIALQVAANESRGGRVEVAQELRRLVDATRDQRATKSLTVRDSEDSADVAIPISRPKGELQNLVHVSYPKTRLNDVVLRPDVRKRLDKFLLQQHQRSKLRENTLIPKARLLVVGPPGSGKTMTASAIAGDLHLPLFSIRLDGVITRFMGESAAKLRLVFDQIASIRGVYLFDEFDAIGSKRTADNDVGEMRRILNSFLQFMEEANRTDSVIVAATNHPDLLDSALFRRFDDILEYTLPDSDAIRRILSSYLSTFTHQGISWELVTENALGLSQADLAKVASEIAKNAILNDEPVISTSDAIAAIEERRSIRDTVSGIMEI